MLGAFVVLLDSTMTNLAVNTLLREFHAPLSTVQWVSTGYLLSMSMVIPLTGWAVDRFGVRTMWMISVSLFFAGSLLCGVSWSIGSLIAFRVLQGVGGGMMTPLAQTILAQSAGPDRLGRVMAAVGVPAMLGPILGPVIGGLFVTDLNWRWIFFVNLPVCLLVLLLSARIMSNRKGSGALQRLDLLGLLLLSPACATIVYGFAEAGSRGSFTDTRAVISLLIGVALLVAFCVHALRTRIEPLIDLRLFRARGFAASAAVLFLSGITLFGVIILLPLYYQQVRGQSALHAGLLLSPLGVGMGAGLVISGRLTDRIGPRPIVWTGLVLAAAGTVVFSQVGMDTSQLELAGALLISGAGMGTVIVPVMATSYRGLRSDLIPRATSAVRIFQQLGGALGGAMLAVILQRQVTGAHAPAPGRRPDLGSMAAAFGNTFWWVLAFTVLAVLPTLLLPGADPARTAD
jgi:EmrB/QacA subfamily drug resistance transporter